VYGFRKPFSALRAASVGEGWPRRYGRRRFEKFSQPRHPCRTHPVSATGPVQSLVPLPPATRCTHSFVEWGIFILRHSVPMDHSKLVERLKAEVIGHEDFYRFEVGDRIEYYDPQWLSEELLAIPLVRDHVGRLLNLGNSRGTIQIGTFARSLMAACVEQGAEQAVARLMKYLELDHNPCCEVALLGGVHVEDSFEIFPGVFIAPISQVPSTTLQNFIAQLPQHPQLERMFSPFASVDIREDLRVPQAALYREMLIRPKICDPKNIEKPTAEEWNDLALLSRITQLLTLAGPSSPIMRRQYRELDDDCILKGHVGHGWAATYEETRVDTVTTLSKAELADLRPFVEKYLQTGEALWAIVDVPLHRLNEAVRHKNLIDKALDLGIALETLLLHNLSNSAQLSYQLRLRGAWLMGADVEDRKKIQETLKKLYDFRSKAAHEGKLPT